MELLQRIFAYQGYPDWTIPLSVAIGFLIGTGAQLLMPERWPVLLKMLLGALLTTITILAIDWWVLP